MGYISKPPPGCMVDWTHPLSRGLKVCWLLNEHGSNVLRDLSLSGNNGTLKVMDAASDWVGSVLGGGLDFDGVDDYVIGSMLLNTPLVTVSIWVSFPNISPASKLICGFVGGLAGATYDKLLLFNNGTVYFYAYDGGLKSTPTVPVTADNWYHMVGVADGVNLLLYCNGRLVGSTACGNTYVGYTMPNVFLGGSTESHGYLGQRVADFRIFNRPFFASEVAQLYAEPYANILSPSYRRYFIPAAGGLPIPVARPYTQAVNRAGTY